MTADLDQLLPGDLLVARQPMISWEDEWHQGGPWIHRDQRALVLHVKQVSRQVKVWTLFNDKVTMFSCPIAAVSRNWHVIRQLPTSGSA